MKILVAEDDAVSRELLVAELQSLGHEISVAQDGEQAWALFQQQIELQVVVSDWLMPKMDGLELCRKLRRERRDHYIYIIMITVLEGKNNYLEAMDAGADDFMTKPFDPQQMAARLCVAERILELRYEHFQLQRLLPICSYCKNIRDDNDSWSSVERYMARHAEAEFSHSICPRCVETVVKPQVDAFRANVENSDWSPPES